MKDYLYGNISNDRILSFKKLWRPEDVAGTFKELKAGVSSEFSIQ